MAENESPIRQSNSYKEFVNNHGVDVAGRVRAHIENMSRRGWLLEEAADVNVTIRTLERMLIINKEDAERLTKMLRVSVGK